MSGALDAKLKLLRVTRLLIPCFSIMTVLRGGCEELIRSGSFRQKFRWWPPCKASARRVLSMPSFNEYKLAPMKICSSANGRIRVQVSASLSGFQYSVGANSKLRRSPYKFGSDRIRFLERLHIHGYCQTGRYHCKVLLLTGQEEVEFSSAF